MDWNSRSLPEPRLAARLRQQRERWLVPHRRRTWRGTGVEAFAAQLMLRRATWLSRFGASRGDRLTYPWARLLIEYGLHSRGLTDAVRDESFDLPAVARVEPLRQIAIRQSPVGTPRESPRSSPILPRPTIQQTRPDVTQPRPVFADDTPTIDQPRPDSPPAPDHTPPLTWRPGAGAPVEPPLRSHLERRLGFDLGGVRLHTDSDAAAVADRLRADAFTVGRHIGFAAGRFRPQTRRGLALLIHELTHVRQQPGGEPLRWGNLTAASYRAMEQQARTHEHAALAGIARHDGATMTTFRPPATLDPGATFGFLPTPASSAPYGPLLVSFTPRAAPVPVTPLRQESAASSEPLSPAAPALPSAAASTAESDVEQLARQVLAWMQRRQRIERERDGVQRWH